MELKVNARNKEGQVDQFTLGLDPAVIGAALAGRRMKPAPLMNQAWYAPTNMRISQRNAFKERLLDPRFFTNILDDTSPRNDTLIPTITLPQGAEIAAVRVSGRLTVLAYYFSLRLVDLTTTPNTVNWRNWRWGYTKLPSPLSFTAPTIISDDQFLFEPQTPIGAGARVMTSTEVINQFVAASAAVVAVPNKATNLSIEALTQNESTLRIVPDIFYGDEIQDATQTRINYTVAASANVVRYTMFNGEVIVSSTNDTGANSALATAALLNANATFAANYTATPVAEVLTIESIEPGEIGFGEGIILDPLTSVTNSGSVFGPISITSMAEITSEFIPIGPRYFEWSPGAGYIASVNLITKGNDEGLTLASTIAGAAV